MAVIETTSSAVEISAGTIATDELKRILDRLAQWQLDKEAVLKQ